MQRLKFSLIGFGFFWIFAWSVFGSILGAKINLILTTSTDTAWLSSAQKSLFSAAHSHMNSMSITTILFALTLPHLVGHFSKKIIGAVCIANLIGVPLFGIGLLLEAFYPPSLGKISFFIVLSSLGAITYMLTTAVWASLFIASSVKK